MEILELLKSDAVLADVKAPNKKELLRELAKVAEKSCGLEADVIFETLLERERLGTTGVGNGIAIPHGRFDALTQIHGLFARLSPPMNFESIDEQPVDLVFLLLAPSSAGADHLKALARVTRLLRDKPTCDKLRHAADAEQIFAILTAPGAQAA